MCPTYQMNELQYALRDPERLKWPRHVCQAIILHSTFFCLEYLGAKTFLM